MNLNIVIPAVWGSVAVGVTVAIIFTHSAWCLWAFLIPAMVGFSDGNNKDGDLD